MLFSGIENALSEMLEQRIDLPALTGSLIAGAIVAGILAPLKRQLEKLARPGDPNPPAEVAPAASGPSG